MYLLGRRCNVSHLKVLGQLDRGRRQIAGYRSRDSVIVSTV
jgi:hypothetical protein